MLSSLLLSVSTLLLCTRVQCKRAQHGNRGVCGAPHLRSPASHLHSNTTLYLPAIGVDSRGFSLPECWAVIPNYTVATDPGTLGTLGTTLGPTQSASYSYFPADLNASLHGPAANQYVVWLSGSATISFPNNTGTIDLKAGSILAVVDNSSVSTGHFTRWMAGTSIMLVQFEDGVVPEHKLADRRWCS